jgi:putative tryptophan/tyrosine transport system substrate-binding protein
MRRRQFLGLLGGAVLAWPLPGRTQPEPRRHVGVLLGLTEDDPATMSGLQEFRRALQSSGWTEGQNVQFTYRYSAGDTARARQLAKELVELQPELIVAHTTYATAVLQQITRALPIVFVSVSDPIASGFVASLGRPGGNMTGFINYEFSMGGKWLEILKEIAPGTSRVALMLNPDSGPYYADYLRSVETVALSQSVQATLAPVRGLDQIEQVITRLGSEPGGGLIILPSASITVNIRQIIEMASRHKLPAIYPFGYWTREGGLVGYGVDVVDLFRRSADYVDRILRGEKPADLPVQAPTKFELIVNVRAAKSLGLTVPPSLLARADEVIE